MNRMMRKTSIALACLMITGSLAGCGSAAPAATDAAAASTEASASASATSEAAASTEPSPAAEPVTLSFLIDNQSVLDGVNAVAAEAEKRFNIKIETELRPGGAEGDNVVKTRLATGDMADICAYNSGSLFQALNPEQNFLDLTNEPFMALSLIHISQGIVR